MNINPKLFTILEPLGYEIEQDQYSGDDGEYIVFNYVTESGTEFRDNKPSREQVGLYIHVYLDINNDYMALKEQIKNLLYNNGFTYPDVQQIIETDTRKRHLIFETEIDAEL